MAIVPLFVADLATLKQKMRLSGLPAGADSETLFEQAVVDVRLGFYDRLGSARVAQIVAMTHNDAPATDDELTRSLAESTEIKWARLRCMETMPLAFLDGAAINQQWNAEAPFRGVTPADLRPLTTKLENEIRDAIEKLEGKVTQESQLSVSDIGPKHKHDIRDVLYDRRGDPWR